MASAYPGTVDTLTNPVASDTMDSVSVPHATQHADANNAIEAIETELGADVAGASVDLVTRLNLADLRNVGYATVATAAGTTTLTVSSAHTQHFTGTTTQIVLLPVTSTLVLGDKFRIVNDSTGVVTVKSSGANVIYSQVAASEAVYTVIAVTGTDGASWSAKYAGFQVVTGTGSGVRATSPTLVTPILGVAAATSVNKVAITEPATGATLTIVEGGSLITAGAYAVTLTATATTGVTLPTTGTLATLAGAETFTNKTLTTPVVAWSVATPAASATQTQAGGTAITAAINRIATVATTGDAVTLPAATVGKVIKIKNAHASNAVGVFPAATGEVINALAPDAVYSLAALKMVEFNCAVAGTWDTILTA